MSGYALGRRTVAMRRPALGLYVLLVALVAPLAHAQLPQQDLDSKPANPTVATPPVTVVAPAPPPNAPRLIAIEIGGRLLEDKERLMRFLGLKPGMVFALETYCPTKDGFSAARIEEEVVVTDKGAQVITHFPAEELPIANRY